MSKHKRVRCCSCGKELVVGPDNPGIHTCYDLQELLRQKNDKLRNMVKMLEHERAGRIGQVNAGLDRENKLRKSNRKLVEALEIAKGCTGFGYGTTPAADIIIDAALAAAKEARNE